MLSAAVVTLAGTLLAAAAPAGAVPPDPIFPSGKADLVVSAGRAGNMRFTQYLSSGLAVTYYDTGAWVTVRNIGDASAPPSWTSVSIRTVDSHGSYSTVSALMLTPGLAPGASATSSVELGFGGCVSYYSAMADVFHQVSESDETNNGLSYYTVCDPSVVNL